ncbi:MAG: winged helix-turn-helix transcriptional regulator [Chloroflexi bacterium]|nr:winged helix-turn-helix transcriptional regulator [Chloroflexota bacterium]
MPSTEHELRILQEIERNPATTQATLASQLGVAVGSVNFVIKRLIGKGYIHVKQLERRRLKYIITPKGIALRSKLTMDSLQYSMRLYRETRVRAKELLNAVQQAGYAQVAIRGESELAEIVALTCLELKIEVVSARPDLPVMAIVETQLNLDWPDGSRT